MAFINPERTEITAKIVYCGPGLSGKTTCFHHIYKALPPANKGKLLSLSTNIDRTIYFDFLPLKFENIQGLNLRIQLYTVPGQVRFNATRKMVLNDVDGLVFVADMQREMAKANQESMKNLFDNLKESGLDLQEIPHVVQYNKEDLPNLVALEELNANLNLYKAPSFVTCALSGKGVMDALKGITKLVVADIRKRRIIEQHLQEVASEVRAAFVAGGVAPADAPPAAPSADAAPAPPPRARKEALENVPDDAASMARRLIQAGIKAPIARVEDDGGSRRPAPSSSRPPSPDTIERHIKAGMFEDIASEAPPRGAPPLTLDLDEDEPSLRGLEDPEPPAVEKEIVVFSDRANELQSGIHRRERAAGPQAAGDEDLGRAPSDPLGLFGDGAEEEIEESLSGLPDDDAVIADPASVPAPPRTPAAAPPRAAVAPEAIAPPPAPEAPPAPEVAAAAAVPSAAAEPSGVDDTSKSAVLKPRAGSPSWALLLPDGPDRRSFQALEEMVGRSALQGFGTRATAALESLLDDAELFPPGAGGSQALTAPAKMNLLSVKYGRFVGFRAITERQDAPTREDALRCLHFLLDVALAKREIGR